MARQSNGNSTSAKSTHQRNLRNRKKRIRASMERLRAEMAEIREEQKSIREGQKEIREKFEEIESECHQLVEETNIIAHQTAFNQTRINLMFGILKARQDNNFAQAHHLTIYLREQIEMQNRDKKSFA